MEKANHEYIVQFDADVIIGDKYFQSLNNCLQNSGAQFVAGPVFFSPAGNLLEYFQTLDMMGMMAVTNAGIQSKRWYMANGANMVYLKTPQQFDENKMASGDDVFKI